MPKPDRWTRRGMTQEQVDKALLRIGALQDDVSRNDEWYRDGGGLKCDSILMLDEIMRLQHINRELSVALAASSRKPAPDKPQAGEEETNNG
jgi:hypothetical protein